MRLLAGAAASCATVQAGPESGVATSWFDTHRLRERIGLIGLGLIGVGRCFLDESESLFH